MLYVNVVHKHYFPEKKIIYVSEEIIISPICVCVGSNHFNINILRSVNSFSFSPLSYIWTFLSRVTSFHVSVHGFIFFVGALKCIIKIAPSNHHK